MKKICFTLLAVLVTANAVADNANHWRESIGRGVTNYAIDDVNGNRLIVHCNNGSTKLKDLTGVSYFTYDASNFSPINVSKFAVSINNKSYQIPPYLGSKWANYKWQHFIEAVQQAQRFTIEVNNAKIATFTNVGNSAILSGLAKCKIAGI